MIWWTIKDQLEEIAALFLMGCIWMYIHSKTRKGKIQIIITCLLIIFIIKYIVRF